MIRKLFLLLSSLFLLTLSSANAAFSDIPDDHIYKDAINYVQEQGIVSGYSDGTYRPDDPITRGEFTKIIVGSVYSAEEIIQMSASLYAPACEMCHGFSVVNIFNDLASTSTWGKYAFVAKQQGIVSGYSVGTFRPDVNITVGEASKILANSFDIYDTDFGIPTDGNWFSPYLTSLNAAIAFPYTLKDIEQKLTRGEMADLVAKLKYKKEGKNFVEDTVNSNLRKVKIYFHDSEIDPQVTDCAANNYYLAFVPFDNTPVRRTVEYVLNTYNVIGQHGYIIDSINLVEGQAEIRIGRTGYGFGTCGGATVSTSVEKSVEALEGVENATIIGGEGTFI